MQKGQSEDSGAERASREGSVTDVLGGPVAASCYLMGNQEDARGL